MTQTRTHRNTLLSFYIDYDTGRITIIYNNGIDISIPLYELGEWAERMQYVTFVRVQGGDDACIIYDLVPNYNEFFMECSKDTIQQFLNHYLSQ